jgi:alanine racemase
MNPTYRLYSSLPCPPAPRTAAEISIPALLNNYRLLLKAARDSTPGVRAICVVKADAYGHGAEAAATALMKDGCDFFAVSCIEEAEALRHALGAAPDIMILGYTDPSRASELAASNIIQTVYSRRYMAALSAYASDAGVKVRTHLKLDTGMNRIGIPAQSNEQIREAAKTAIELASAPGLVFEGMFTHFARADEEYEPVAAAGTAIGRQKQDISGEITKGGASDKEEPLPDCGLCGEDFTELQFSRYRAVEKLIEARGIKIPCRHICNSAASVRHPEYRLDCVRFGIMLYGLLPSGEVDFPGLLPVMKLRSVVSHVHDLLPGASVGYGGCFTSNISRRIATLPVGYADGFIRAYTGGTIKIYHDGVGYKVKIVGRICMDQLTADISGTPCEEGDSAVLFGDEPGDLEQLSRRAGTIGYESLCIISSRVPRYYV